MIFYFIISVALATVLFLCLYLGFRTGLRLGMNTAQGKIPAPVKNPVEAVIAAKQDIEQLKISSEEAAELAQVFAYNGDIPKEKG